MPTGGTPRASRRAHVVDRLVEVRAAQQAVADADLGADAAADPDDGAIDLGAVHDAALGDEGAVDVAALQLRRGQEARMRVDGAGLVVEIERRDRIAQRQVGLEVRLDGPDVLPVAAVDVRLHALARDRVGDDVPAEVDELRVGDRLLEDLAPEDVDAHRGQIAGAAPGELRDEGRQPLARGLLVEVHDPPRGVHLEDPEPRRLILGDRDDRHRRVGAALAVGAEHLAEVHAVELIARQDHHVARRRAAHVAQALAHGVRRPLEPVAPLLGLLRGQHRDEARRKYVELVGHRDVLVEALRVELGEHEHVAQIGVQAVADRDVDEPVLAADRNGRLRALEGQRKEARPASAPEDDRQHVVHVHVLHHNHRPDPRLTITVTSFLLWASCFTRANAGRRRASSAGTSASTP